MALTTYQQPQLYTPAYNKQTFTSLSDQIAVADFEYQVTIQVNGGVITNYPVLQRPDGRLVFDPIEWVKNFIEREYFTPTNVTCLQAVDKAVSVEVKIKEYYTGIVQSTATYNYTAYDACLTDEDFSAYVYTNYVLSGTNVKLLSPTSNNFVKIENPDVKTDVWIHFFRNSCTSIVVTNINTAATFTLTIPTTNNLIYYANVGYATCLANGITLVHGDIIEFTIKNGVDTKYTGGYVVNEICTNYQKYTLYFLDRQGNIQFKHFELKSTTNISKKTNKVKLGKDKLNTTTGIYGSNAWDREDYIVSTATETTKTLSTNWLSELQSDYLIELYDSPLVWSYDQSTYKAVTITNTTYEPKLKVNDKLFQLELTVDLGITQTRQRGI